MNRETWLNKAIKELGTKVFNRNDIEVPPVKISVGFTSNRGDKQKVLGACWSQKASNDNVAQIFIVPTFSDSLRVLDVLAHELIHAIKPDAGHGKDFKKIALKIGLQGPMRSTNAGPTLTICLKSIIKRIGKYPHSDLNPSIGRKKQGTRMLKAVCFHCGYIVRLTKTWAELGLSTCYCGGDFELGV